MAIDEDVAQEFRPCGRRAFRHAAGGQRCLPEGGKPGMEDQRLRPIRRHLALPAGKKIEGLPRHTLWARNSPQQRQHLPARTG